MPVLRGIAEQSLPTLEMITIIEKEEVLVRNLAFIRSLNVASILISG